MNSYSLPSIASGNQACKKICADFPIAANKNNKQINVTTQKFSIPAILNTAANFSEPQLINKTIIPMTRNMSPTRLVIIALIAALPAAILVLQKLINR